MKLHFESSHEQNAYIEAYVSYVIKIFSLKEIELFVTSIPLELLLTVFFSFFVSL